jgi:hypothetical protein
MKRQGLTVNAIGTGKSTEAEKRYKRYCGEVMINIGARPKYIDGGHMKLNTNKRLSEDRFSTNYKTREEFDKDRSLILNYLCEHKIAPEDIVKKVTETVTELDLQCGE